MGSEAAGDHRKSARGRRNQSAWRDGNAAGRWQSGGIAAGTSHGAAAMKLVAVLGGGPAGAFAAERLSSAGLNTVIFDEKLAWEKPCGGGLTYKAYHTYPFLIENNTPKKLVTETILAAPRAKAATLKLSEPLLIYSRMDLNRMMLERAERAGARIEKARVLELTRTGAGWRLRTNAGALDADFCVIAKI